MRWAGSAAHVCMPDECVHGRLIRAVLAHTHSHSHACVSCAQVIHVILLAQQHTL